MTITQVETNQKREGITNDTGGYSFPNIPAGTYQVDVALTGFQSFSSRGVIVRQNTSIRVDVKLTVGALQETILVSGTAAVLQTENAAVQMLTSSEQTKLAGSYGPSALSRVSSVPERAV